MAFESILFEPGRKDFYQRKAVGEPDFFIDLNLDQLVKTIIQGKEVYNLSSFYYQPLKEKESVLYRQQVMKDFEDESIVKCINEFSQNMRSVWDILKRNEKLFYHFHKLRWFLEAVILYCNLIETLASKLSECNIQSTGLIYFTDFLKKYQLSEEFHYLKSNSCNICQALSSVKYCLQIKGSTIRVRKYLSETNYSDEVLTVFEKFKQKEETNRLEVKEIDQNMNHVEAEVLDCVARLFPEIFSELDSFFEKSEKFVDNTIKRFEQEIQFYISYTQFIEKFKATGLNFCFPNIATQRKEIYCSDGFDLALAQKLFTENRKVICNDFTLSDMERIVVISGPNQGGKTTFARMIGQLNYLGALGCPIPAREASIFLFDHIFTHFERQENIINLRGKLQDDLIRINDILKQTTSSTLIIMNEIFTSTTSHDAIYLGTKIIKKIIEREAVCICVTFIDELTSLSNNIVSMMSIVDDKDQARRSFKVCRKPADGLAYSKTIVEKYHLTYPELLTRISL